MLTSNHRKLVNACYPASLKNKGFEGPISPDPNSLSKLIYYCSTRPHKIQKVSAYLLSYARTQALPNSITSSLSSYRNSKPGLICTIRILLSLVQACNDHLQSFSLDVMTILATGLGLSNPLVPQPDSSQGYFGTGWTSLDFDITCESMELFSTYADALGPDSLQDEDVARNYLFFLAKFSSVAMSTPSTESIFKADDEKALKNPPKSARCLALMALHSSAQSLALCSSAHFTKQLRLIIPGLMATFSPSFPNRDPDALLEIICWINPELSENKEPLKKEELVGQLDHARKFIDSSLKPDSKNRCTESDLISYSIKILHYLLKAQTTNLGEFEVCIVVIFSRIESAISLETQSKWYECLGRMILSWSAAKYRSIVVDVIVDRLTLMISSQYQLSSPTEKSTVLRLLHRKSMILLQILISILKDPVSAPIELLNVMKIINQLVHLMQLIIKVDDQKVLSSELNSSIVEAIGALAFKIHYDEQINDMCRDLFDRVRLMICPQPTRGSLDPAQTITSSYSSVYLIALMDSLNRIIVNSHGKLALSQGPGSQPSMSTSHLSVSLWKDSLLLLNDLKDGGSRLLFLKAFSSFIELEAFRSFKGDVFDQVQLAHLNQLLSAINVWVYRSKVAFLERSQESKKEPNQSFDQDMSTLFSGELSVLEAVKPMSSNQITENSKLKINKVEEDIDYFEEMNLLSRCMVKIQTRTIFSVVTVCLPMLKQLDKRIATTFEKNLGRRSESQPDEDDNIGDDNMVVIRSLENMGSVWEIESLKSRSFIQNGAIDWAFVVQELCHGSRSLRDQSGLNLVRLNEVLFQPDWNVTEGNRLAGWPSTGSGQRSLSITASNRPTRTPSPRSVIKPLNSSRGAINPVRRNSALKNYNTTSTINSHSLNRMLRSSPSSTSVADLRESLLVKGFRINSRRRASESLFRGTLQEEEKCLNGNADLADAPTSTSSLNNGSFNNDNNHHHYDHSNLRNKLNKSMMSDFKRASVVESTFNNNNGNEENGLSRSQASSSILNNQNSQASSVFNNNNYSYKSNSSSIGSKGAQTNNSRSRHRRNHNRNSTKSSRKSPSAVNEVLERVKNCTIEQKQQSLNNQAYLSRFSRTEFKMVEIGFLVNGEAKEQQQEEVGEGEKRNGGEEDENEDDDEDEEKTKIEDTKRLKLISGKSDGLNEDDAITFKIKSESDVIGEDQINLNPVVIIPPYDD